MCQILPPLELHLGSAFNQKTYLLYFELAIVKMDWI